MKRKRTPGPRRVREPIQIYMEPEERELLDSLAADTRLPRAEILRRGLKMFAADRAGELGPMQRLLQSLQDSEWPADVAREHDAHLASAHLARHDT
ncbi:MAG TPA: ribbon-helix-helix domain-containing protein [Gemmatimonadaceae bacterium]